jgi:two-component system LytT family response regulator
VLLNPPGGCIVQVHTGIHPLTDDTVTKIRTLVVDDERMARERVLALLRQQPDIEVVGECADGAQALSAIERLEPELVFLDIQIPVMDGFGVIRSLAPHRVPIIVFTTAYDEYALRAFEVHALDYLLKPFDGRRFLSTLQRARDQLERQRAGDLGRRLLAMVQDLRPESPGQPDRLVVKSGGRIHFVRVDEIDWVDAAGNYVRLHAGSESYLLRETMTAMESRLDSSRFVRIHRCHIVNADRIRELQTGSAEPAVVLRTGVKLPLSRGYKDRLQERVSARR